MSLLKLGSLDLGTCPACGRKLFPAAYVIRDGHRFHHECFRPKRARRTSANSTLTPAARRPAGRRAFPKPQPAPIAP